MAFKKEIDLAKYRIGIKRNLKKMSVPFNIDASTEKLEKSLAFNL